MSTDKKEIETVGVGLSGTKSSSRRMKRAHQAWMDGLDGLTAKPRNRAAHSSGRIEAMLADWIDWLYGATESTAAKSARRVGSDSHSLGVSRFVSELEVAILARCADDGLDVVVNRCDAVHEIRGLVYRPEVQETLAPPSECDVGRTPSSEMRSLVSLTDSEARELPCGPWVAMYRNAARRIRSSKPQWAPTTIGMSAIAASRTTTISPSATRMAPNMGSEVLRGNSGCRIQKPTKTATRRSHVGRTTRSPATPRATCGETSTGSHTDPAWVGAGSFPCRGRTLPAHTAGKGIVTCSAAIENVRRRSTPD